jgi:hypothetical protein
MGYLPQFHAKFTRDFADSPAEPEFRFFSFDKRCVRADASAVARLLAKKNETDIAAPLPTLPLKFKKQ